MEKKYKDSTLGEIKWKMKSIMGEWDGDNPGVKEDMAYAAEKVLEAIKNVEELLAELE